MKFRVLEIDGGYYAERKSFLGKWEFAAWDSDKLDHTGRSIPTKFETAEEAEQTIRDMYTPPVVKTFSLKTYFRHEYP
jgi:spermidine synthase